MAKIFNVTGACIPTRHYMVDPKSRLEEIKRMVDAGDYFSINRGRQYGKTTTMRALTQYLKESYVVVSLDFQKMTSKDFMDECAFVNGLAREVGKAVRRFLDVSDLQKERLRELAVNRTDFFGLAELFECFSEWCDESQKPIVLLIDEVDTASNNQVFLDFLALLRAYYLDRDVTPTFQSVILAGVYDIRNLKRKIRQTETPLRQGLEAGYSNREKNASRWNAVDEEHKQNSPWNIAADFNVSMSFSADDIAGMLTLYEADYQTGMDIKVISGMLYDYTSGYPFLVSRLCKLMDETLPAAEPFKYKADAWTAEGVREAVKMLLSEKNTLFDSMFGKLNDYPEMKYKIFTLLFQGQPVTYNADDPAIDLLCMFGFVKEDRGTLQIANRIFETRLYNYFLARPNVREEEICRLASRDQNQFVQNGFLDMKHILKKFVEYFDDIYGNQNERFVEEDGRRYFMLFLKPVINGTGNYYVESRTRNQERTDLIVDYRGAQYIIEMKIYRGNAYNERGEKQLSDYLEHYHLQKGYMLSFNFNKKKKPGVSEIVLGDKLLIEAVV
ncbi:MAG: ATP-binding protein [Lachnospiraceae bacterium]|nr:ATP-binding protein [Lachnospiraceae bacterium]